jgi:hypothetical protein
MRRILDADGISCMTFDTPQAGGKENEVSAGIFALGQMTQAAVR